MNRPGQERVHIRQLPTGVPGLDEILGGGLPEYSFNILAGAPGSGKTTLAHQIMFANAGPQCPTLYFTVLGEPAVKMLRYQQQFTFFDLAKIDGSIRFVRSCWRKTSALSWMKSSGRSRFPKRASSWWTRSAPWYERRSPARAKWNFRGSSSASPCT